MGINRNVQIAAEIFSAKPSRLAASAAMQQAERLLAQEVRPTASKPKAGKQALRGRVRVERSSRWDQAEAVDFNDEVEREYHWGVVCHTRDGEWYVTTAAVLEDRMDLNSVQVRHHTDRVIGVMGFWEHRDLRFAPLGMAHRDWAATDNRMIVGWQSDKEYYFYRK